jgi:hypothetical protein
MKNSKKMKNMGHLPCVCTRQRTFGHFVVCTRTAKGPRGAQLCSWELLGGMLHILCRAAWGTCARQKARHVKPLAHGNDNARQSSNARRSEHARQRGGRTATKLCTAKRGCTTKKRGTAKMIAHGKALNARQRLYRAKLAMRTATNSLSSNCLPCDLCRAFTERLGPFAVRYVTRQSLVFP